MNMIFIYEQVKCNLKNCIFLSEKSSEIIYVYKTSIEI